MAKDDQRSTTSKTAISLAVIGALGTVSVTVIETAPKWLPGVLAVFSTSDATGITKHPAQSVSRKPDAGKSTQRTRKFASRKACKPLQIKWFTHTGDSDAQPRAEVNVDPGYKIIGGGALVNWRGHGNLLTASYPETPTKWVASAKEHAAPDPATVTAWAIAIYDPKDEWDVEIVANTGDKAGQPRARATLPAGYTITGGGARVNWAGYGNLLTASYPVADPRTWEARAKDHTKSSPATVTAYVIGVKARRCKSRVDSRVVSAESESAAHPTAKAKMPEGYELTGGGALVNWAGDGSLLTGVYPADPSSWEARAKDHAINSPASVTAYAIGVRS